MGTGPIGTTARTGIDATSEAVGPATVLRLRGTLHAGTASDLREIVHDALDPHPTVLVLDLAGVTATDDLGLWVLPAMTGDAARHGVRLLVAAPGRPLRLRLRRLGGHPLDIVDSAPSAAARG